jgi:hypothetical protein
MFKLLSDFNCCLNYIERLQLILCLNKWNVKFWQFTFQNDSMIQIALSLLATALETGAEHLVSILFLIFITFYPDRRRTFLQLLELNSNLIR